MVKPILADRFIHILDAIAQVRLRTAGLDLETFKKDRFLQLGVERCLEIISEATRHIPADLKDRQTTILGGAFLTLVTGSDIRITRLTARLSGRLHGQSWESLTM
jgi:hypothetical protein